MKNKYFVHQLADVKSSNIGLQTKIWQFSIILEGATIGNNCNINCHCFVENDVIIGNNVTVKSGVYLWDGLRLGDNVFIGPNVTFVNDKYPRSKKFPQKYLKTVVENGVSIGAGATILGGVKLGSGSMIGAGSLVTKEVPPGQLWHGNPAKFVRAIN